MPVSRTVVISAAALMTLAAGVSLLGPAGPDAHEPAVETSQAASITGQAS